ncbi:cysteine-rich DPF motif domain-containing protein 1-like [Lingula anatina]|uniref:Cysteine-rich DPF motif domain-containing protein 1 n=1 Tax=Lingula anatina TaxID=7574 RepID=A0A1S3INF3_LINAN|nr:cysteine-rich DPF motif domain-containing protein 1-like [Lingula anatina]|eukprot:XP_013399603.1 cysteine-rich DPF motif domain-containing protein 1-like [Lingula anatina]
MTSKFLCSKCGFCINYDYFGNKPPGADTLLLLEEAYIMNDPFAENRRGKFIILGSHCSVCSKSVCIAQGCSIFYTKRFCIDCVIKNLSEFPTEVQEEAQKRVQNG